MSCDEECRAERVKLRVEVTRLRSLAQSQRDVYADEREATAAHVADLVEIGRKASNARIDAERERDESRATIESAATREARVLAQLRAWREELEGALAHGEHEAAVVARAIVGTKLEKGQE